MLKETVRQIRAGINKGSRDTMSMTDEQAGELVVAAELLMEIHRMANLGELDGVDLDWMVKADSCVGCEIGEQYAD